MRNKILALLLAILVIGIDWYLVSNSGGAPVVAHRKEYLKDYFSGNAADWIGLIVFNAVWFSLAVTSLLNKDFYDKTGAVVGWGLFIGSAIGLGLILIF